jgi:hypothetical protein
MRVRKEKVSRRLLHAVALSAVECAPTCDRREASTRAIHNKHGNRRVVPLLHDCLGHVRRVKAGQVMAAQARRVSASPGVQHPATLSAPSTTSWKPTPYASRRDRSRPARQPGEAPHAACPGDARHPPRNDLSGVTASVRRDTPQRPGPRCPAQQAGTKA